MGALADEVLPLIRTRADLHRWGAASAHGRQMHRGLDILDAAVSGGTVSPRELHDVTHRALVSAITVIARADDSSGVIGQACRRLLVLHPRTAAAARVAPSRLVDWMMTFQFEGTVDYFELDPVAYAPALGPDGQRIYRARLQDVEASLGPEPTRGARRGGEHRHERFVLEHNAQRLAVLDRDVDAIVRTHGKDLRVAAWLQDVAEALAEIGEIDLALDWARRATYHDEGHQSQDAGDHWYRLVREHRPDDALAVALSVMERWPSASTAQQVHESAGDRWGEHAGHVSALLAQRPSEAVLFALETVGDVTTAWHLANDLALNDAYLWDRLADAYGRIDPGATLPVHQKLVERDLARANAPGYRRAAKRLAHVRRLLVGSARAGALDAYIADLRETHRRRPRLLQELDQARLP